MTSNAEPEWLNGRIPGVSATRFADVRHIAETGSTNADLLDEARRGFDRPLVLVTDHQTAGRGRQDRSWFDWPGDSLLVSVLVEGRVPWVQLISLATGLAVREAVIDILGGRQATGAPEASDRPEPDVGLIGLKWPNDVLVPDLGERKLAGILVETLTAPPSGAADESAASRTDVGEGARLAVVIGVGVNLGWSSDPPADVAERATTVTELWRHCHGEAAVPEELRNELLVRYLIALDQMLDLLPRSTVDPAGPDMDPHPVIDQYRSACLTLGRTVAFEAGSEVVMGEAVGIGPVGELVIRRPDGSRRALVSGEAHHLASDL